MLRQIYLIIKGRAIIMAKFPVNLQRSLSKDDHVLKLAVASEGKNIASFNVKDFKER